MLEELRAEVHRIAKHGPDYLERYVDSVLEGKAVRPGPGELHGISAKLIRELAADAMIGERMRL